MSGSSVAPPTVGVLDRRFPPVIALVSGSLALAIGGGIFMAATFPDRPPLALPVALLAVSGVLLTVAGVLTARLHDFAGSTFRTVFGWTLLAYVVQAGMIGFAFVHNHARGRPLVVLCLLLVLFAVDVPFLVAFTAARYALPPSATS